MPDKPRVLLFDLGGVLVEWEGIAAVAGLTGGRMDVDAARWYWLGSAWVRGFESGRCGPEMFCEGVVRDLRLDISPSEFLERFISWDRGPQAGALELLDRLRSHYILACLSNNNPLHWERLRQPDMFGGRFHHEFISYQTGHMKPDSAAYEQVLSVLGCPPGDVLFFDDSPECVEGSRRAGIRGHVVQGVPGVLSVLSSEGIYPAP
jgi:putative hydrolase of the HAD superfamily